MKEVISTECVVIGGGIIGLAIASELARNGKKIILLEKEDYLCQHTSSRNSEVIHSGIYYKPDSLKASLCKEGNELLYQYCNEKGIEIYYNSRDHRFSSSGLRKQVKSLGKTKK